MKIVKKQILLIDEDKDELRSFTRIVNHIDPSFRCMYADAAKRTLHLLPYAQPDFVFTNYHLPEINGLQLLSAIKFEPRLKAVKVFIYSESIDDETIKMAKILGAAGCIEKGTFNDLAHQFKAIFSGELLPSYVL